MCFSLLKICWSILTVYNSCLQSSTIRSFCLLIYFDSVRQTYPLYLCSSKAFSQNPLSKRESNKLCYPENGSDDKIKGRTFPFLLLLSNSTLDVSRYSYPAVVSSNFYPDHFFSEVLNSLPFASCQHIRKIWICSITTFQI